MPIALYPTYSDCLPEHSKFPSQVLIHDERSIVRFVNVRSSAPATQLTHEGARLLTGIISVIRPEKKEWDTLHWKAVGFPDAHDHYHWNVGGCTNYLATFLIECLIFLETRNKDAIRNDMVFVEPE